MFFSDDLLTGKKGSLGIIWLMATIGPRSKRVTRKAIANVEISRTCEIIAQPPEPMALRLSGHLLVGVARVFSQSCTIFYDDVQSFDMALRRSVAFDATSLTHGRGPTGLDMPGDGRSRIDQITFPEMDPSAILFDFDLHFGAVDWRKPLSIKRPRRTTSKLSSLLSQTQSANRNSPEREDSETSDDETDEGRPRKQARSQTPFVGSIRQSVEPFGDTQRVPSGEEFVWDEIDLNILEPLPDADSGPSYQPAFMPDEQVDIYVPDEIDIAQESVRTPAKRKSRRGSEESASDVETVLAEPAKRNKKKPKMKVVTFDDSLEMSGEGSYAAQYVEEMLKLRTTVDHKKHDTLVQVKVNSMVDRGGLWMEFLDPDMSSFVHSLYKAPDKFKWELDVAAHRRGEKFEVELPFCPVPAEEAQQQYDLFIDQPYIPDEQIPDVVDPFEPLNIDLEDEVERARRISSSQNYPWEDVDWDMPPDLPGGGSSNVTPVTDRKFSIKTPNEIKIRQSIGSRHSSASKNRLSSPTTREEDIDVEPWVLIPDEEIEKQRGPFSAAMLALLENQCRDFFSFVESRMIEEGVDEIGFQDMMPPAANKRVAAAAFHNVLTLATKRVLAVNQAKPFGEIDLRIAETGSR